MDKDVKLLRDMAIFDLRKKNWALQKIGDLFGISRERARQIIDARPEDTNNETRIDEHKVKIELAAMEYVKRFKETPNGETIQYIIRDLGKILKRDIGKDIEVKSTRSKTGWNTVPLLWRLLDDLDSTWRSFVSLANLDVKTRPGWVEEGWDRALNRGFPEIWGSWQTVKMFQHSE